MDISTDSADPGTDVTANASLPTRKIGRSPLELSTLGFGAWEAGGGTTWGSGDEGADAIRALTDAVDGGMNWVDTAHVYGGHGGSEEVVGQVLRSRPELRVATKVAPEPADSFTAAGMRRELTKGLRRLGREKVDLYLLHWPSEEVPLEETWGALAALRDEGLVSAIGLSNYSPDQVRACQTQSQVDAIQISLSMLDTVAYEDHQGLCADENIAILSYGSLAYGLLADPNRRQYNDWRNGEVARDDFFVDENYLRFFADDARSGVDATLRKLMDAATDMGRPLPEVAIQWLLALPGVTSTLIGSRSPQHVNENIAAAAAKPLTDAETAVVNRCLSA